MSTAVRTTLSGIAFLAFGIASLYVGADLEMGSVLVPGPGALAKAALWGLVILSILLVANGRGKSGIAASPGDGTLPEEPAERGSAVRIAVTIASILAFILAVPTLGFLLSSAVLMAVLAGLGSEKPWSPMAMLGGLLTAVAAHILFVKALGVPLPAGSLWGG
jgi:tripartite tricarboxylate transporter TctB family protein